MSKESAILIRWKSLWLFGMDFKNQVYLPFLHTYRQNPVSKFPKDQNVHWAFDNFDH